jgi:hypothetical protein
MTKSLLIASLAMFVSFSASAKQQCTDITGTFHNLQSPSVQVKIQSVAYGDIMIYSLVGFADGVFYADGKARSIVNSMVSTVCIKDGFQMSSKTSSGSKIKVTIENMNEHKDLIVKLSEGAKEQDVVLVRDSAEATSCQK